MRAYGAILCASAVLIGGCAAAPHAAPPVVAGADRDAHGCIASAGYAWCTKEQACVRPWELASGKGFDRTPEGFERYCENERD